MNANSIPYEIHSSAEFASLHLNQFGMIIVACDQNQLFYDDYAVNAGKFEAYVADGGFLNFCSADNGWNGGTLNAPLPGGMISTYAAEDYNVIDDPAHPVVAGVPNPFWGSSASHIVYSNLPTGAHIIVHGQSTGEPTMVEYGIGSGWMIGYGQTLEITYDFGWDGAPIVPNAIFFGYNWGGTADIPWLSEDPISGTVLPGECTDVTVTFDSNGVMAGEYFANLLINSDDPDTPVVNVPVTMIVGSPTIVITPPTLDVQVYAGDTITLPMSVTNEGTADLVWELFEGYPNPGWTENFDSYATGSQMHGQGGWKGWGNVPGAGALTSDVQSHSTPNSVAIEAASDLVHEYSGYTSDVWTYTVWQYVPSSFSGISYFLLLNSYDDPGNNLNWSTQLSFDSGTLMVANDGPDGGTLPLVTDQWVEIRVDINLDNNTQTVYYGGDLLFTGSWTEGMSGGGVLNIAAVDLYANSATVVYYDDISLVGLLDIPWLSLDPMAGATLPGESSLVDVSFDFYRIECRCIHCNPVRSE